MGRIRKRKTTWHRRASDWLAGYFQASFREGKHIFINSGTIREEWMEYADMDGQLSNPEKRRAEKAFREVYSALAAAFGMDPNERN